MTETPVPRLVLRLAVPSMVSMVVTALYNVVDAAFVGHLSTEATAGIGISFAYMTFIQAVGFFFGHGSGNFISRALGSQKTDEAERMAATGFFLALLAGTLLMAVGLIFLHPLVRLLGSTDTILPYSTAYIRLILIG